MNHHSHLGLDGLGRLGLGGSARLGDDGGRATAEEEGVGLAVRSENEGVGGDSGAVADGQEGQLEELEASTRGIWRLENSRGALDLNPRRKSLVNVELLGVGQRSNDILLQT